MTLEGFGITLKPLSRNDIELVRVWRNSEEIRQYALNQEYISQEQQEKWFESLQTKGDEYFLIYTDGNPIGLIWFNQHEETIETGFYIYEKEKQNSLAPYKIVTLFHNYLFNTKRFKTISCKIMHSNPRAIRFNLSLGYREKASLEHYRYYELSDKDYRLADIKISKLLSKEHVCR